jgi:hypothetical protein
MRAYAFLLLAACTAAPVPEKDEMQTAEHHLGALHRSSPRWSP